MQHHASPLTEVLRSLPSLLGLTADTPREKLVMILADGVEVRRVAPVVLAQITVAGDPTEALQRGVEHIDRHLDGHDEGSASVARTSEIRVDGSIDGWRVARVLWASGIEDLPRPRGGDVRLVAQPEQLIATTTCVSQREDDRARARLRLFETLGAHPQLRVTGEAQWVSRGPASFAFLQRNEARVQLDPACVGPRAYDTADAWGLSLLGAGVAGGL